MNTLVPDKLGFFGLCVMERKGSVAGGAGLQPWGGSVGCSECVTLLWWHSDLPVHMDCRVCHPSALLGQGERKVAWPQNRAVQGHHTLSWAGNHTCTCKKGAAASPGYKQLKWGSQDGLVWGCHGHLFIGAKSPYFTVYSHLCLQVNWDKWRGWPDPSSTVCNLATKAALPFPLYRGPGPALPLWSGCSQP